MVGVIVRGDKCDIEPLTRRSRSSGEEDLEAHCEVLVNGTGARSIARLKRPFSQNASQATCEFIPIQPIKGSVTLHRFSRAA